MQIKTTMRYHLTTEWPISKKSTNKNPQTINAGEGVEKVEPSHTVDENVN